MDPKVTTQENVNNEFINLPNWTDDEWDNFNSEYSIG